MDMTQVGKLLLSKNEALSLNPTTAKKIKNVMFEEIHVFNLL
jgi:hypothetical protein